MEGWEGVVSVAWRRGPPQHCSALKTLVNTAILFIYLCEDCGNCLCHCMPVNQLQVGKKVKVAQKKKDESIFFFLQSFIRCSVHLPDYIQVFSGSMLGLESITLNIQY